MSFSTKELNKYQDALHENLLLLTMEHPPSREFQSVFKRNMFAKSNKAAFHHVMYYLLSIFHPQTIKEVIPSWPILEIKMESQFRNEVFKCVNELNNIYKDADIPPMMSSHFVSPGGPKFVKFIFKLTQLALLVLIDESGEFYKYLGRIKKSDVVEYKESDGLDAKKQFKPQISKIKMVTKEIQEECIKIKKDFNQTLNKYKTEGEIMKAEEGRIKVQLPQLQIKLKELESSNIISPSIQDCINEVTILGDKIAENNKIREKFDVGINLVRYLLSKDSRLEYQSHEYKIPKEVSHVIKASAPKLDVINLLKAYMQFIEKKRFDIKEVSSQEVEDAHQLFFGTLEELTSLSVGLDDLKKQFNILFTNLSNYDEKGFVEKARKQIVPLITVDNVGDSLDSTLATPLQDSPL